MIQTRLVSRGLIPRTTRGFRVPHSRPHRFQSTSSAPQSSSPANAASPLWAGVAGGTASALLLYGIYYLSPAGKTQRTINKTAKQASDKYRAAAKKLEESTPTTDQAIDSIKQFAYSYLGWIPGGRAYVDAAFQDVETIRQNNGDEADAIVNDAYKQLRDVAKAGLSLEALSKLYDVIGDISMKLAGLGKDAWTDLLDNHPELKEKLGGSIDELKQLGEQCGPEAKKQVKEVWDQLQNITKDGFSAGNLDKARKLLSEKVQKIQQLRDQLWEKGLEEAKPYLEKSPKVKELVEKNADALRRGNAKELFNKARAAIESGRLRELEKYVKGAVDKTKSAGSTLSGSWGSVDKLAQMIPDGDKIVSKLRQLREIADKHKGGGRGHIEKTPSTRSRKCLRERHRKSRKIAEKGPRRQSNALLLAVTGMSLSVRSQWGVRIG